MSKLSFNQKRVLLIVSGLLVLVCTFFFLFQKNMDTVTELENETRKFQNQINYLTTLQMQVNEMKEVAPEYEKKTEDFTSTFSCKVPQQKAYYYIYQMMTASGVKVTHISAGKPQTFLRQGEFFSLESEGDGSGQEAEAVSGGAVAVESDVEKNPEASVAIDEMVGKNSVYQIELSGTQTQILKAVDWVAKNKDRMAVSDLSLAYDNSNGKLSGTATLNFFELNGNGRIYKEPDVSGIAIGTESIFGKMKQ